MTETHRESFFSRVLGLAVLLFCFAAVPAAPKAVTDFYVIRDIAVDETAASAAEARTIAVANGQKRAFDALLRRLVPASDHGRLPRLDDAAITPFVSSFQVANERSSATRYLADLTFEFHREDVRGLLRSYGLPFSEAVAGPILVLPVYIEESGKANLWQYPNPWRGVWSDVIDAGVRPKAPLDLRDDWAQPLLQPVILPAGDLADVRLLDAQMALNRDPAAISTLQRNYEVVAVHVISARPRVSADGAPLLEITWKKGSSSDAGPEVFRGTTNHEDLMQSAVFELLRRMQEEWKARNILDFSTETVLAVTSRVGSLDEWLRLQRQVESLSNVSAVRVRDLSVGEVFWNITYIGSIEQLITALEHRNIALVDHQGYWTINFK